MAVEEQQQREFQIDDPEELSQKTRIKELLARRTDVINARDQAFDAMTLGQASEEQALNFYRSRVESLILDLWTKFENEDLENGREYLESKEIDSVPVPPPEEFQPDNLAPGAQPPETKAVRIEGLQEFITSGGVVQDGAVHAEFTVQSWDPPGLQTMVVDRKLPRSTIDEGLVTCMKFIDETGIDIEVRQDKGDHGFDYSDIIEHGPPGQADDMSEKEVMEYGNE